VFVFLFVRLSVHSQLKMASAVYCLVFCLCSSVSFAAEEFVTLNNGVKMPTMLWGSGGSTQENSTSTAPAVRDALDQGFPGIDCANHYHNQIGVAEGIAMSKKKREEIWLQTKVEPCGNSRITPLYEGHCYNQSLQAFQQNLVQLNVDFVDLTMIHAPPCVLNSTWADPKCYWPDQPDAVYPQHCNCAAAEPCHMIQEQWKALEKMYKEGKTRSIGVSNFCAPCLKCIFEVATIIPQVNQLQFHVGMPGPDPEGLVSFSASKNIHVQAYSALGGDQVLKLLKNPEIEKIAAGKNQSTSQIVLKWVLQLGHSLATSTTKIPHMQEDMQVYRDKTWELSENEMKRLNELNIAPDDPVKSMCLFR
jgi:diketogulonate reductase-like aldo/keto reductase